MTVGTLCIGVLPSSCSNPQRHLSNLIMWKLGCVVSANCVVLMDENICYCRHARLANGDL